MRKDYVHSFIVPSVRHCAIVEQDSRPRHSFCISAEYIADKYDVRDFLCPDMPDLPSVRAVMREQAMNSDF